MLDPLYLAARGAKLGDLYAMGVILFHMLSGAYPFRGRSYPMLVVEICSQPPIDLRTLRGAHPGSLACSEVGERMVTHQFGPDRMDDAFAAARSAECIKAVVRQPERA